MVYAAPAVFLLVRIGARLAIVIDVNLAINVGPFFPGKRNRSAAIGAPRDTFKRWNPIA